MKQYTLYLIGSIFLFELWSCSGIDTHTVVVQVGSASITVGDLQRSYLLKQVVLELPENRTPQETEEIKRSLLDELISHRLLLNQAQNDVTNIDRQVWQDYLQQLRHGYDSHSFQEQLKKRGVALKEWEKGQKEKFLIQQWITTEVNRQNGVSEEELKAFYNQHIGRFVEEEKVRALHIVVSTRNEAEDLLRRLKSGEKFSELARQFSTGLEASNGGDLGYFTRKDYPPAFTETCFNLKRDQYSEIVPSDYGFHLFQVTDRRPKRQRPFREVASKIQRFLISQKVESWVAETLLSLRQKTSIKIEHDILRKVRL